MKTFIKTFCLCLLFAFNANAQSLNLISDEETEVFLQKMAKPIYLAAGVPFNANKIYIVNDNSLNAFIGDGNNLFMFTGTIISADHKNEIEGVIAHEVGHILGGHILRMKLKNQEMQITSLASMIAAGAAAALSGRGDVGMAIMLGSQSSLMTNYTGYRVEEERSADESAVKLLAKIGKSPSGVRDFMKLIQKKNQISGIEETPYFRTHPITSERVAFLSEATNQSPYPASYGNEEDFLRVKAKLIGYLDDPKRTLLKYPLRDSSVPAKYARSVAYFKQLDMPRAMKEIDELIAKEPSNPFFKELKGQMYLETGKISQAHREYQSALNALPDSANFQQNLAAAMIEDNPSRQDLQKIVDLLNKSLIKRPSTYSWLLLSRAYGMLEDNANANYAAAEYSLRIGNKDIAKTQASEALRSNPNPKLSLKINDLLAKLEDNDKK